MEGSYAQHFIIGLTPLSSRTRGEDGVYLGLFTLNTEQQQGEVRSGLANARCTNGHERDWRVSLIHVIILYVSKSVLSLSMLLLSYREINLGSSNPDGRLKAFPVTKKLRSVGLNTFAILEVEALDAGLDLAGTSLARSSCDVGQRRAILASRSTCEGGNAATACVR